VPPFVSITTGLDIEMVLGMESMAIDGINNISVLKEAIPQTATGDITMCYN
jgi:hypothetical protein